MRVLIVGAGIGGLTLAGFLKDSSVEFEIVDKVSSWDTQGFSIGLWNNGRHILAKLGLADKFDKEGSHIKHYRVCDSSGKLLRKYDLSEFYTQYGLAYTHISRTSLHNWLLGLVEKEKIALETQIKSIEQVTDGVKVEFNSGKIKNYDFVIGADGIHSKVRSLVFGDRFESFDNWRVWYVWINNFFNQKSTVTEYVGAGEFVGLFDVGEKTLAVFIAPANHSVFDNPENRLRRLKKIFNNGPQFEKLFSGLKDTNFVPTDLSCVKIKKWFKNRVVLLGDAAHGFEPHAGLGASMAMEDAYVLAAKLIKISGQSDAAKNSHETIFANYQKTRELRVKTARALTNRMRAWAFIKSKWLRKMVNIMIPFIPQTFFTHEYHKLLKEKI